MAVGLIALAAIVLFFGVVLFGSFKDSKEYNRRLLEEMEEPFEPSPAKAVGARVIYKNERIEKWGNSRSSDHRVVYEMTFDTDEREVLTFEVGPDTYYRYNELDCATLVTVDGKFFHFGDGEDANENEI